MITYQPRIITYYTVTLIEAKNYIFLGDFNDTHNIVKRFQPNQIQPV